MLRTLVHRLRSGLAVLGTTPGQWRPFIRRDRLPNWTSLLRSDPDLWQEALAAAGNGTPVLIATNIGGHGLVSVMESMLAIALTLRCTNVHLLLCDGPLPGCLRPQCGANGQPEILIERRLGETLCPTCYGQGRRVYDQLGLPVYKRIDAGERTNAREVADTLDLPRLQDWIWNRLGIGEHVRAGALRYYAKGQLDLADPEEAEVLRRYVEASLVTARALKRLEVTVQRARKYAYHFFFRRMIPLPFVESMAKAPNFRVELRGLRDLLPGACPGLDVICDGILDASRPFICPAEETGLHDANGRGTA